MLHKKKFARKAPRKQQRAERDGERKKALSAPKTSLWTYGIQCGVYGCRIQKEYSLGGGGIWKLWVRAAKAESTFPGMNGIFLFVSRNGSTTHSFLLPRKEITREVKRRQPEMTREISRRKRINSQFYRPHFSPSIFPFFLSHFSNPTRNDGKFFDVEKVTSYDSIFQTDYS